MIDLRKKKTFSGEIEDNLNSKTDRDIMLNFASALNSVWPHTCAVELMCYDPWEEFLDSFFEHLVANSFCWKYGLSKEELGLYSLSYPDKNKSKVIAVYKKENYTFILFGYPDIDLEWSENFYFGKGLPLNNRSEMKFTHALCNKNSRESVWLPLEEVDFYLELSDS